jgi:hypothetical protein
VVRRALLADRLGRVIAEPLVLPGWQPQDDRPAGGKTGRPAGAPRGEGRPAKIACGQRRSAGTLNSSYCAMSTFEDWKVYW